MLSTPLRAASAAAASAALVLALAPGASAAPSNAPDRVIGTADCGSDGSFTFIVNSGNSQATTWTPAFITRSDGRTALFRPVSFDLTFTSPFGGGQELASKHGAPGPVVCRITGSPAAFPEATLSGTVTGTLVWTS